MKNRLFFNLLKGTLGTFEKLGIRPKKLDADALEAAAVKKVGLTDFGASYYRSGLTKLVGSANQDADLNPYGRMTLQTLCETSLVNRLLFAKAQQETPALFTQKILPPLIIMGLPRTGTTHLHRLLAADPNHRAVPFWEMFMPFPQDQRDTPAQRIKQADGLFKPRRFFTPELDAIHYIRPDAPEECMFMLLLSFESVFFWVATSVYGYIEWFMAQDRRAKYQEYAKLLRVLQQAHPEKRLVLKAPEHTDALHALLEAVPEALIVQTHRDPAVQVASYCSLSRQARLLSSDTMDHKRVTATDLKLLETVIARNLQARDRHPNRVYDVRYDDLVNDPIITVKAIYSHYGLDYQPTTAAHFQQHIQANPQHKHGVHRYTLRDSNLTEKEIQHRFGDYASRFC